MLRIVLAAFYSNRSVAAYVGMNRLYLISIFVLSQLDPYLCRFDGSICIINREETCQKIKKMSCLKK